MRLHVVFVLLLFAGCAEPSRPQEGPATPALETPAPAPVEAIVLERQPLEWEGETVAGAWACETAVLGECAELPDGTYSVDAWLPLPSGNVTQATVELTWSAADPLATELTFGGRLERACASCEDLQLGEVTGSSPLAHGLPPGLALIAGDELHLWVYNPTFVAQQTAWAGASTTQPFQVAGVAEVAVIAPG